MKSIKIYSTTDKVKRRRRRIGEFSDSVRRFKQSLSIEQKIALELKLI